MASSFLTRFRSGPYLRNEQGTQKYAEMALGQLVRTVAKKSRFYREQSENLLVEKANLRQRQQEMADQPILEPGAYFKLRPRLFLHQIVIAMTLIGSMAIVFLSLSAFLAAATPQLGMWRWILSAIFAAILGGGGLVVTERLVESLMPQPHGEEGDDRAVDAVEGNPRGAAMLWLVLLGALLLVLLGLAEVRAAQLQEATGSRLLYLAFLVGSLVLPLLGGAMRWDSMRYISLYKTTQMHREVDARLSQIDSVIRQTEEFESNFYKVRLLTTWDELNAFRTVKENYNARKGISEPLTGHFASAFDLFQAEAARRYESDLRDLTAKSLRRLDSVEGAAPVVGGKLGQGAAPGASTKLSPVPGVAPRSVEASAEVDGEELTPEVSYDAPGPDSPLYLTPKPVR